MEINIIRKELYIFIFYLKFNFIIIIKIYIFKIHIYKKEKINLLLSLHNSYILLVIVLNVYI